MWALMTERTGADEVVEFEEVRKEARRRAHKELETRIGAHNEPGETESCTEELTSETCSACRRR